jgi:NAD(P)-dependent dehydrogenase (short-subunit alcohol dehydrogenase family)
MQDKKMTESLLSGKVAIVTGAASGIGKATALALSAAGAAIAVLDRDARGAAVVAQELQRSSADALPVEIDLSDAAAIPAAVGRVIEAWQHIDILVNCAGITGKPCSFLDTSDELWDHVYAINIKAPFILTRLVGRHMIERGAGGRIVNVTSSSAHRALMSLAAYGSSKAALAQLTRSAAAEFGPHGINVNAVAPGVTETPTGTGQIDKDQLQQLMREGPIANLLQRISQPEDIAATILFLCLPASRQITGQTIHVSAGAIV